MAEEEPDKDDKTEDATSRKLEKAAEKGDVPRSQELKSAVVVLITLIALRYFANDMFAGMQDLMTWSLSLVGTHPVLTRDSFLALSMAVLWRMIYIIMPIMIVIVLSVFLGYRVQGKIIVNFERLQPSLANLNPISGFKRVFKGSDALVKLLIALVKVIPITMITYSIMVRVYPTFLTFIFIDVKEAFFIVCDVIYEIAWKSSIVLLLMAMCDLAFQKYKYTERMKMTKKEVKDEMKSMEGDPQIKRAIRQKGRSILLEKMMQEVPDSDVVITNPTHIAIAIRYSPEDPAPKVVAIGAGDIAMRIRELAAEHGVMIAEDKPLAQALYREVEVGYFVPPEYFSVVAEIIAMVYRSKGKSA